MPERFDDLEPMPADVLGALDAERGRPGLSPAHHAALVAQVAGAIAVLPPPPLPSGSAPAAAAPTATATGAVGTTIAAKSTAAMVALFTAGAVAGGAGGAALHAKYAEPRIETRTVYVQVPAPAPTPPPPAEPAALAPVPEPAPAPTAAPRPQPPKVRSDLDLAVERDLLEFARSALAKGHALEALEAVHKHQARFPKGRLSEERESIAIQALLAAGRKDEARIRSESFRKSFPESLLLPLVESLMEKAR